MEQWTHGGEVYEVNSMYVLPDDAWAYELTGPHPSPSGPPGLAVLIPDATPVGGPFTPVNAEHGRVSMTDGSFPWLVLVRFVRFVDASGDILVSPRSPVVPGDLSQSRNAWNFAGRAFEVNSFHFAEHDCWCYELYEIDPTHTDNNYVDVRIPDLQPVGGPFAPAPAEHVTFTGHGTFTLPWQVFRHFVKAVEASGNINRR